MTDVVVDGNVVDVDVGDTANSLWLLLLLFEAINYKYRTCNLSAL